MTPRPTPTRTRLVATLAVLVATGTLSACAGAQPGVAARVGDETIRVSEVNRLAGGLCSAYERQLEGQGTVVPMSIIASNVVQTLAMTAVAEQMAEEHGITPSATYATALANLEQSVADLDEDAADARLQLETSVDYVNDILTQVGRQALEADGISEPGADEALAKGQDELSVWLAEHDPEIDPQYGLELVEVQPEQRDTSTSFAVSDLAVRGAAAEIDPEYARSLPESQRCG